jgi:cytochrome c peroxidase
MSTRHHPALPGRARAARTLLQRGTSLAALALLPCLAGAQPLSAEPIEPIPLSVVQDARRVALGARLFSDKRVSHTNSVSCASCHPLDHAGVDGRVRAIGADPAKKLRNTPTVFNIRYNLYLNWDGAHESLARHTEAVLLNPSLMGTSWPELLANLKAGALYDSDFKAAYPAGLTRENVLDAVVSYEQSLITPNARFDRYLRGQKNVLSDDEIKGYQLFKSYGCVSCHQGINIGGNLLQRFGVFASPDDGRKAAEEPDPGRARITKDPRDAAVFRVPSLRNVAVTGPYFHDGRAVTLDEAVRLMAQVQLGRTLSALDVRLIVAFLRTLTGEFEGLLLVAPAAEARR